MGVTDNRLDEIKRKTRNLKKLEMKVRFGISGISEIPYKKTLVWDVFFDLGGASKAKAKYPLHLLASMSKEEYKNVMDEYLYYMYYQLYKENRMTDIQVYNPDVLSWLNLPIGSNESDIKKRFRELAKKFHPDVGGDADKFIELMDNYKKLI